jgi:hypothetical protein
MYHYTEPARFGLDHSHWSEKQKRRFENGGHSLSKALQNFSCMNATYDTAADTTIQRTSQARKLFSSMNEQVFRNKTIPIDFRRRLYQAIVVNIALWRNESWALKEENRKTLETFHHTCLRRICKWTMRDTSIAEKRITKRTG